MTEGYVDTNGVQLWYEERGDLQHAAVVLHELPIPLAEELMGALLANLADARG